VERPAVWQHPQQHRTIHCSLVTRMTAHQGGHQNCLLQQCSKRSLLLHGGAGTGNIQDQRSAGEWSILVEYKNLEDA